MGKILKKFFCEKKSSFSDVERNFFVVLLKFSVGLSKLNPTHPKDILSGSSWFLKKLYFFPFFLDIKWKIWGFLSKKFRWARQNCILRVHRNTFKKWIFPINYCFPSFQDSEQKKFRLFFQKNFGGVVKTISYVSIETFWWKNLNIQSINISGIQRENCGFVSKIFSAQPSKLNSRSQYESMKKCKNLKKKIHHFRTLSDKSSAFSQKK